MRKLSKVYGTLILIGILLLAVACSNDSGSSGESSDGKTVIKYWSMWNTGEPQQEVLQNIIDEYEAENDDVEIDVQWMGREVLSDVRNASLGDDGPDLTEQSGAEVAGTLFQNDLAEPLDDILSMEIPNEGSTFIWNYKIDGKTYFIPYEIITSGFHYNENLFEEYGVEVPET